MNGVLAIKEFRTLWLGQLVSQLGDSIYMLVFLFIVKKVAGEATSVALVAFCGAVPYVLLGPLAGIVADRYDRKRTMILSDVTSFLVAFGLFVSTFFQPEPNVYMLGAATFLLSSVNTFFMPARSAAIPRLVPESRLIEASGLAVATQQTVHMLGIAVSAFVLGAVYKFAPDYFFRIAVGVNCLTFLGSCIILQKLPSIVPGQDDSKAEAPIEEPLTEPAPQPIDPRPAQVTYAADFAEHEDDTPPPNKPTSLEQFKLEFLTGLKAIQVRPVIYKAMIINCLVSMFISGFMVAYVEVNDQWYGGEFHTLAYIEMAFMFVMVAASLVIGRRGVKNVGAAFAWGTFYSGLLIAAMAWGQNYPLMIVLNAVCGVSVAYLMVPFSSYMQASLSDDVRGRVLGTWTMLSQAVNPLGLVLVGVLITAGGVQASFWVMGLGMVAAAFVGLTDRRFMTARMPSDTSQAT